MIKPIEKTLRQNLIAMAKAYARANRIKLATVSRRAHGDAPFFDSLVAEERGKTPRRRRPYSFTARKYDEVMGWFAANWPEGLDRPPVIDPQH